MPASPPLIVVAGATATGKTELGIRLGEAFLAEGRPTVVISADSRQVYRGLDIGTAKATADDRARVPHFGLDLVDPDLPFSLADFATHAREVLSDLAQADAAVAILAGGTGLYLRAIATGLDTDSLPSDPAVRARIEAELDADGLDVLVTRLRSLAPSAAARVDLRNPRRVVRALEIAELAGDVPPPVPRGYPGPVAWIGLALPPLTHATWIAHRARAQFDGGLIDEAATLRERYDPLLPAFSAIGYREAWAVLDGTATLEDAIARDAQRNTAFAKRQRTWFRSEHGIRWFDPTAGDPLPAALDLARSATG